MVFVLARQVPALLDLACGRGGDIWKWIDADVQSVLGVDISEHEVAECRRRSVTYIPPPLTAFRGSTTEHIGLSHRTQYWSTTTTITTKRAPTPPPSFQKRKSQ